MRLLVVALASSVAGCAIGGSVTPMGPDTYSVSASASPARGGPAKAREIALQDAADFCQKRGEQILVMDAHDKRANIYGAGSANIVFRCLLPGDPELQRPKMAPDIIIEQRQR